MTTQAASGQARRSQPDVRAGNLALLSDSGLHIAQARGFFARQGLGVQLTRYNSASELLAALRSGTIDAGCVPVSAELFNHLAAADDLKIVAEAAGAAPGNGASGLIVRSDLAARVLSPTDLRDFRIAMPARGDYLDAELTQLLREGWLTRGDIETVVAAPVEIRQGLETGTLEAAMLAEPYLADLERTGSARIWRRSDRIVPSHSTAVLVLSTRLIAQHPERARRFMTGYLKAVRVYNDVVLGPDGPDRAALLAILARATSVSDPTVLEQSRLPGINPNGMINLRSMQLDQVHFLSLAQQDRLVRLASTFDSQFAAFAITQLGEYR